MLSRRLFLVVLGMLSLLGCTRDIEYAKDGALPEDLYWDRYECIAPPVSRIYQPIPGPKELDRCLVRKGWRRIN
jgi:hypothetical protein